MQKTDSFSGITVFVAAAQSGSKPITATSVVMTPNTASDRESKISITLFFIEIPAGDTMFVPDINNVN
ncbi:TPA: hypothetical protein ACWMJN_000992 [Morganella morganii]